MYNFVKITTQQCMDMKKLSVYCISRNLSKSTNPISSLALDPIPPKMGHHTPPKVQMKSPFSTEKC
jgi:hypothetical protein